MKCGYVTLENKGALNFNCKMGKKGQSCKVKCNKAPKNKDTPKKIACVDDKWSDKKGKKVYDTSKFGCVEKEGKSPYGGGKTTTKKVSYSKTYLLFNIYSVHYNYDYYQEGVHH